jgi:hypothetical protein
MQSVSLASSGLFVGLASTYLVVVGFIGILAVLSGAWLIVLRRRRLWDIRALVVNYGLLSAAAKGKNKSAISELEARQGIMDGFLSDLLWSGDVNDAYRVADELKAAEERIRSSAL